MGTVDTDAGDATAANQVEIHNRQDITNSHLASLASTVDNGALRVVGGTGGDGGGDASAANQQVAIDKLTTKVGQLDELISFITVQPDSHYMRVTLGTVPGETAVNVHGFSNAINAGDGQQSIIPEFRRYAGHSNAVPVSLEAVSTNDADSAASIGMRSLRVWGLKTPSSTETDSELIVMNGTTPASR